jgi:hypothetical protein
LRYCFDKYCTLGRGCKRAGTKRESFVSVLCTPRSRRDNASTNLSANSNGLSMRGSRSKISASHTRATDGPTPNTTGQLPMSADLQLKLAFKDRRTSKTIDAQGRHLRMKRARFGLADSKPRSSHLRYEHGELRRPHSSFHRFPFAFER